jgi:hypothetical protein
MAPPGSRAAARPLTLATFAGLLVLAAGCSKGSASAGGPGAESARGPAAVAAAAGLALPSGFEGEVDVTAKGDNPTEAPVPVALFVKSGKVRVNVPEELVKRSGAPLGGNAYVILDSEAKKLYAVLDSRHQVVLIDLNKAGEQLKGVGSSPAEHGGAPAAPATKVTKTGKFDTVAGYKCENWEIASDHREGTACVADEGFSWFSFPTTGIPTERLWAAEVLDGKHFPLRYVGYSKEGAESVRVEVTKIDKKALPATDFEYPPSYVVLDLATMFRGMAGLGGMPGMGATGGMPPGMPPGMTAIPGMPPGMAFPPPHPKPH